MRTRQEEVDRLAEIEAMPRVNEKFKKNYREDQERKWMLEDAGVTDMMRFKHERMMKNWGVL